MIYLKMPFVKASLLSRLLVDHTPFVKLLPFLSGDPFAKGSNK